MFTLLPLPFFMDGEGDVAVSVSSLLCSFVSDQSCDRNRKRGTLCKQIKLFSESRFGRNDAAWESFKNTKDFTDIETVIRFLRCCCVVIYCINERNAWKVILILPSIQLWLLFS